MIDPSGTPRHQDLSGTAPSPANAATPPPALLPPAVIPVAPEHAEAAKALIRRYETRVSALGHHRLQALQQERALVADIEEAASALEAYIRVLRDKYVSEPQDKSGNSAPYSYIDGTFVRR